MFMFDENVESSRITWRQIVAIFMLSITLFLVGNHLYVHAMGPQHFSDYEPNYPSASQGLNVLAAGLAFVGSIFSAPVVSATPVGPLGAGIAIASSLAWLGSAIADVTDN